MFVIDTGGYDVILGITWLNKYHAVIDCQSKSVIFRISHQQEFQFVGESRVSRHKHQRDCVTTEAEEMPKLVVKEFFDVSKKTYPDYRQIESWSFL